MRSLLTFIPLGKVELKVAILVLSCDLSHQERPTKGKYFPLINKGLLVGLINLGKEILLLSHISLISEPAGAKNVAFTREIRFQ